MKCASISLDTQIRPTFDSMRTPYEVFEGKPPNLDEIFPFRLGQLVTVTKLSDQRCKTDHNLAGIPCYVLHPENVSHTPGTWLYCPHPDIDRAYLRSNIDIQPVEYAEIPNQSKVYFRPQDSPHKTYPTGAMLKLIDEQILKQDEARAEPNEPVIQTLSDAVARDPYVGQKVRAKFGSKWFEGIVDHVWANKDRQLTYHVEYKDGDTEDYTAEQIATIIVKQTANQSANAMVLEGDEDITEDELEELYSNSTVSIPLLLRIPIDNNDGDVNTYKAERMNVNSTVVSTLAPMTNNCPLHIALKHDKDKWSNIASNLMDTHISKLKSMRLVNLTDIPSHATILPSQIYCVEKKVDTSREGEHVKSDARFVIQDTLSKWAPAQVFSSVASAKGIKLVIQIGAHNRIKLRILDVYKAFPSTPLPTELRGRLFIKLPRSLCYEEHVFAEMLTAIEGMKLSNHIYDKHLKVGLLAYGFKTCPNDDQIICKREDDGNFLLAAKVVDNIIFVATSYKLEEQLTTAMQACGYTVKIEASDKFIGMQIEYMTNGDILLHQLRHESKLIAKYNIARTASTPLPSSWSLSNHIKDGSSAPIVQKTYQQIVGDTIYLGLTNTGILHANSAVAQKTQYCSRRDYDAVVHILEYIKGHPKQGIIFRASRNSMQPLAQILDRPIAILFSHDGAHNPISGNAAPRDQAGYYEKLYDWDNGAIQAVSKALRISLSSTETEVAALVLAMRNSLDTYFVLNWIGFKRIGRIISHGDSTPCQDLCTELTASQRRSRHFNMHTAWVREFVDNNILSLYHTPTNELTANALTKRVASTEQQWAIDDIRGARHHAVDATRVVPEPIRRTDHTSLWAIISCSAAEE